MLSRILTCLATSALLTQAALAWSSGVVTKNVQIRAVSTHDKVIVAAYGLTRRQTQTQRGWPTLAQVRVWEGLKGPDGEWMRGEDDDKHHYCNPDYVVEDAAYMAERLALDLRTELRQAHPNTERVAKLLASIEHYVADAMSPPHSIGNPRDEGGPMDDWFDPNWDNKNYNSSKHFRFETEEFWQIARFPFFSSFIILLIATGCLIRRKRWSGRRGVVAVLLLGLASCLISISISLAVCSNQRIVTTEPSVVPILPEQARAAVREAVRKARARGTWSRYVVHGWDKQVEEDVRSHLLPEAATLTGGIWLGAAQ